MQMQAQYCPCTMSASQAAPAVRAGMLFTVLHQAGRLAGFYPPCLHAGGNGGAVYVDSGSFMASQCLFSSCTSNANTGSPSGDGGGYTTPAAAFMAAFRHLSSPVLRAVSAAGGLSG